PGWQGMLAPGISLVIGNDFPGFATFTPERQRVVVHECKGGGDQSESATTEPLPVAASKLSKAYTVADAVSAARSILDGDGWAKGTTWSKSALTQILDREGFTVEQATKAIDRLDIDWECQAWQAAAPLNDKAMPEREVEHHLIAVKGFTPAQAHYGARHPC
ncbi:MAG: hypothetical protein ACRDPB_04515, partial [Nocardioidaceae bacterium]